MSTQPIDREALVARHRVRLTKPDAQNPLTVGGSGDFAYTADITGMQTFRSFHDPAEAEAAGRAAVNTCTMSTWGWHEMPNPRAFTLEDAMTEYDTPRGTVSYPDRFTLEQMLNAAGEAKDAGTWLHVNPQRIDLGRVGLELRQHAGAPAETDPAVLEDTLQELDLWKGRITSTFRYEGEPVKVVTVAHPVRDAVAFRIESPLLADGRAKIALAFAYPSTGFNQPNDWDAIDRHATSLASVGGAHQIVRRMDATSYIVGISSSSGAVVSDEAHRFVLDGVASAVLELVVEFAPEQISSPRLSFDEVAGAAGEHWQRFWTTGGALELAAEDPRAHELERRVVLSQYLTAVNCAGTMPPQETGLVTNSWQGKAHLEMHWWHAAHFAAWGRPELLRRSLAWYRSIFDTARKTATRQHYEGVRWPKQVGPDGRESPAEIGALLIWQQPHILYLLELLHRAEPSDAFVEEVADVVTATAEFMASFVEERDGVFHLPAPVVPAQEFYDSRTTEDPTFELGYWWWGLEIANRWRERSGHPRVERWQRIQDNLARPHLLDSGYAAIGTPPYLRTDDHPSMLAGLGVIPASPLIEAQTMSQTIDHVLQYWQWDTAWGWDFPVVAMAATRVGRPAVAVDALMMEASKNSFLLNGHNPQMGNFLPIYLPGNGALLAAVSLMAAGWDGSASTPGFPDSWRVRAENIHPWP